MVIRSVNLTFFLPVLLTVNPLLCAGAQNEKKDAIPEPEGLGAIFFINSSKAALLALERQTAKASAGFQPTHAIGSLESPLSRPTP